MERIWSFAYGVVSGVSKYPRSAITRKHKINTIPAIDNLLCLNLFQKGEFFIIIPINDRIPEYDWFLR